MAVRVGFIGAGGIARAHMRNLASISQARLTAFADTEKPRAAAAAVSPIMSLLESHAQYVQECLRRSQFADAVVESHFDLPALLFRMFGGAKLSQYTDAVPQVAEAMSSGTMDALYAGVRDRE